MDPSAVVLALAILVVVGWVLIQPLFRPARRNLAAPTEISSLETQVDQIVDRMRQLDFDHALGKVAQEEYSPRRAELLRQETQLLQELDRERCRVARSRSQQEEALEREIAARRHSSAGSSPGSDRLANEEFGARQEFVLEARKNSGSHRGGRCPRCGQVVQVGDRFCPHCGLALNHLV